MTNEFVLNRETMNELETFSAKFELMRELVEFLKEFVWGEVTERHEGKEIERLLCRNVTDHKTYITGGNIQNYYYVGTPPNVSTLPVSPSHVHAMGKIQVTVHNGLVVGDEVILLRQQGGQKYIVVDRIG